MEKNDQQLSNAEGLNDWPFSVFKKRPQQTVLEIRENLFSSKKKKL